MNINNLNALSTLKNTMGVISLALLLSSCVHPFPDTPKTDSYNFEIVPDDEADKITYIAEKTIEIQNIRASKLAEQDGQKLRGVHPKTHGCVIGEMVIIEDIPAEFQVGLFSNRGQKFKTLIRYSNASVRLSPDLGANNSRGMAIKVFDVDGHMLVSDKGENNQDFLMINTPAFAFPNVQSYKRLTDGLLNDPKGEGIDAKAGGAFSPTDDGNNEDENNANKTFKVILEIQSKTVRNPLEVQYFGAAPFAFGDDRVMKFSAEPCGGEKHQEPFPGDKSNISANYLHEALAATMSQNENVCLDFKVQVLDIEQVEADREKTDVRDIIEDATRVWNEEDYPFTKVAKITLPTPQVVDLSDATQQNCQSQSFHPWHALTEHKPLGGMNRLRNPVYTNSAENRSKK